MITGELGSASPPQGSKMKKILIAGNAVTADIINQYLISDNRYSLVGLCVDDDFVFKNGIFGSKTLALSKVTQNFSPDSHSVIMAMGYGSLNKHRERMFYKLKEMGYEIETYIHPDAKIYSREEIGEGSVVLGNAVIEPHVKVGVNTMVWCNSTLAHHSSVGDHCWIASGAVISGQAVIRNNVFVGVNATIVNKVEVADHCVIGAGALISKCTKPSTVHLMRSAEQLRFTAQEYEKHFGI